jgi:hypothetical protein
MFKNVTASPKVNIRITSALSSKENNNFLGECSKLAVSARLYENKIELALIEAIQMLATAVQLLVRVLSW